MNPIVGQISTFAGNFAPKGWALCDGQTISIAQNSALFSLLGTTYGGNGTTTFKLPDLRGRSPMHPGTGAGLPTYRLGQIGGLETVALTVGQMASHNHGRRASSAPPAQTSPHNALTPQPTQFNAFVANSSDAVNTFSDATVGYTGSGLPHENMQPYLVLNFIIALVGVFPSRN